MLRPSPLPHRLFLPFATPPLPIAATLWPQARLKELVAAFDANCDGELDFGEFCELLKKVKGGGLFAAALQAICPDLP